MLPGQAAVTQLACVLNVRQPPDHILQLAEGVEAEMAIAGVPQTQLLHAPCSQANGLLHLQVKQVQLVPGPLHLGGKSTLHRP